MRCLVSLIVFLHSEICWGLLPHLASMRVPAQSCRGLCVPGLLASVSGGDAKEEVRIRQSLNQQAPDISFENAQVVGAELASVLQSSCAAGEAMPARASELLRELVSTSSGARGWFVTLLTDPAYDAIFRDPIDESLLAALVDNPDPNIRLMTLNLAMSTATELVHRARGHLQLAAASAMTRDRSKALLVALVDRMPELRTAVQSLQEAAQGPGFQKKNTVGVATAAEDNEFAMFCENFGYSAEQKEAIGKQASEVLDNKRGASASTGNDRRLFLALLPLLVTTGIAGPRPSDAAEGGSFPVQKVEDEWLLSLTKQQYAVLRQGGTEPPNSSPLTREDRPGTFKCAGCRSPLFRAEDKFESRTGWPSFAASLSPAAVAVEKKGFLAAISGAEVRCPSCGGRLGERFPDGSSYPGTPAVRTGKRFCINGAGLVFEPADGSSSLQSGDPPSVLAAQFEEAKQRGRDYQWRMADGGLRPI
mmetsp:Transcript_59325/g.111973  ORF Transcript_59325/g.111973 Transcript_59325/m.111973 type:complete len:477 (-) Transcript_59325:95-1525(-)